MLTVEIDGANLQQHYVNNCVCVCQDVLWNSIAISLHQTSVFGQDRRPPPPPFFFGVVHPPPLLAINGARSTGVASTSGLRSTACKISECSKGLVQDLPK